jgi:peptide-methionine (S)-S-oxide reductase
MERIKSVSETSLAKLVLIVFAAIGAGMLFVGRLSGPVFSSGPKTQAVTAAPPKGMEVATISGGCFWAMEERFKSLKGVTSALPGYAGGKTPNPSYEEVCSGNTGYAESVNIVFDPKVLSYHDLLDIFMHVHNPTTPNQQGNDSGTQYRSVIFYRTPEQKATAMQVIDEIKNARVWRDPIVTQVVPYTNFYRAEDYHIGYCEKNTDNGYCQYVVGPEVQKFRQEYKARLK